MDKLSASGIERGSAASTSAPPSQEAQLARLRAIRRWWKRTTSPV